MTASSNEPGSDDTMLAGMEELIAIMKDRKPSPHETNIGNASTLLPNDDAELGDGSSAEAMPMGREPPSPLERGTAVGRLLIVERLGAGAMGVVYAAYDPELDRKVALKLLLPGSAGGGGRLRLLREAQALAKLSHPNVVAIHDVGSVGEQVWIAMELVQGQTLRQWIATLRGWREVLATMLDAGRGLAAAHAAGLLHRDFKPDNVMVGDDGRVRVMDFGLARVRTRETLDPDDEDALRVPGASTGLATRAGTILGTPGYMSAEQFDGADVTAAADQFSFCVTLWEALHGERPFHGRSWEQLAVNVMSGKLRPPPKGRVVPAWLQHACERGLSVDPRQRWPSMDALLDVLGKGHARARTRKALAAVGVLALVGAGIAGYQRWDVAQRTAACEASGDELETAWNAERRQALRDALVATGVSYAETTADKAIPWIDAHATAWREARVEACLDADVRGRWNGDTLERSLWCLDERRMELQSLVDELTAADSEIVPKAVTAAAGLPSVAPCRNMRALERLARPPEADREVVQAVRADVARAGNLVAAGRYAKGRALIDGAVERAMRLDWPPLRAAARIRQGTLLYKTGANLEAERVLEAAYFEAADGIAPELACDAALALTYVVGYLAARPGDGWRWSRFASMELADLEDDGLRRSTWLGRRAILHATAGEFEDASTLFEQALLFAEGSLGPQHPTVASLVENLGNVRYSTGAVEEAASLYERTLMIREEVLGSGHPDVAASLISLANVHSHTGEYAEAKAGFERAMAIQQAALGADHPDLARSISGLGGVLVATGAAEEATTLFQRELALRERTSGSEHPEVAETLVNLAWAHIATEAFDDAASCLKRAVAIDERLFGHDSPVVAHPLVGLAYVALEQGRPADALPLAQRAVTLLEAGGVVGHKLEEARFVLARALWDAPADGDRTRALSLAKQARDGLRELGASGDEWLAHVERWLERHEDGG